MALSHGMCISPDRISLYVNAILEQSLRRFDTDTSISASVTVATVDSLPDGMSDVDAEINL